MFGIEENSPEFGWIFDGGWARWDNTPHGAAKRIDYLLEHGVPDEFRWPNDEWVEVYS